MYVREELKRQLSFIEKNLNGEKYVPEPHETIVEGQNHEEPLDELQIAERNDESQNILDIDGAGNEERQDRVGNRRHRSGYIHGQPGTGKSTTTYLLGASLHETFKVIWLGLGEVLEGNSNEANIVIMHKHKKNRFVMKVSDIHRDLEEGIRGKLLGSGV